MAIPSNFRYSSFMTVLTKHRLIRIRKATAADIGLIANQEAYQTEHALREILGRIEVIKGVDPAEALLACEHALRMSSGIRPLSPDVRARTLAVCGSTARCNGDLSTAIERFSEALKVPRLSRTVHADIVSRLAVVLVISEQPEEALTMIEEVLSSENSIPALTVRGWIKMLIRPLEEALADCIGVVDLCRQTRQQDYCLFAALVNACTILSYETCDADDVTVSKVREEVEAFRDRLPTGGSNYSKVRRQRLSLARADALLLVRAGHLSKAAYPLKRAAEGLKIVCPDDALDAYTDLICVLAGLGRGAEAAQRAKEAVPLLDQVSYLLEPRGRHALISASKREAVSAGMAQEIRIFLRFRKSKS